MSNVKPVPEGYETVTSSLSVHHGTAAFELCKKAFDAHEVTGG